LSDRLVTAIIAAAVMAIMAIGLPIGLLFLTRGKGVQFVGAYLSFASWGSATVFAAAITGLVLGSQRTTVLFGHLWLTERPRNSWLSLLLWIGLVAIGVLGYYLLPLHDGT
jgi:hypothetical protein